MFKIELIINQEIFEKDTSIIQLKNDFENIDSSEGLLMELCDQIADHEVAQFEISGFGQYPWFTETRTELAILLEQLPVIFEWINAQKIEVQLDFYEQGLERTLHFKKINNKVEIRCESWGNWHPHPSHENITLIKLSEMLTQIFANFCLISDKMFPWIKNNPYYLEWLNSFKGVSQN